MGIRFSMFNVCACMVIPPHPHPPDPGGIKSLNAISFERNPDNSILFEDL